MKIFFFCENANQVHISHALAHATSFPAEAEVELLMLDWQADSTAWVGDAIARLGWGVALTNIFPLFPTVLQREFRNARNITSRQRFLVDGLFLHLKAFLGRDDVLLVQYNDSSFRGRSMAHTCRQIGLKRLLVQDGFLNFVSKTNALAKTDTNFNWGASKPEYAAVWGSEMKRAILERHNNTGDSIRVVGITKQGMEVAESITHRPAPTEKKLRVLWADQAILDQNKAPRETWLAEFSAIASALSDYDTQLRLHPSTMPKNRKALEDAVKGKVHVVSPDSPKLDAAELATHDVVVTYYSTVFIDCLQHNIPCVVFHTDALDIELPRINHPLMVYCDDIADLPAKIREAAALDIHTPAPESISEYLHPGDGIAATATLINDINAAPLHTPQSYAEALLRIPALSAKIARLSERKILIIGTSFGNHIGVGKPVKVFAASIHGLPVEVEFHLETGSHSANLLEKIRNSGVVLINGFDVARTWSPLFTQKIARCLKETGKAVGFYCHETTFVFERLKATHGYNLEIFIGLILRNAHILTVSDIQADWLASIIAARSFHTVYNSVGDYAPLPQQREKERPIVLMVGTQQKRKGVDLFSEIADMAAAESLPYRFVWLGAHTSAADECYFSDKVEWVGHVDSHEVKEWLSKASLFFLSSVDEPFALSIGEALRCNVPCLVYAPTGVAEFIRTQKAGEVYGEYHAQVVYPLLKRIVEHPEQYPIDQKAVDSIFGIEAFCERMLSVLSEMSLVNTGKQYATAADPQVQEILARAKLHARQPLKRRVIGFIRPFVPNALKEPGKRVLRRLKMI